MSVRLKSKSYRQGSRGGGTDGGTPSRLSKILASPRLLKCDVACDMLPAASKSRGQEV